MTIRRSLAIAAIASAVLGTLTGCGVVGGGRTSNQGGGNILTAGTKVAQQQLSALTADEIQILGDFARSQNSALPEITDEQAAAISNILVTYGVDSFTDIQNLFAQFQADPSSVPADVISFLQSLGGTAT